jgi:hypothetical protein
VSEWVNLHALWQILVAGLICGAGLPAIFVLGLRALSMPAGERAVMEDGDRLVGGSPGGIAIAGMCFAVVAAGIAWGIYFIVAGT